MRQTTTSNFHTLTPFARGPSLSQGARPAHILRAGADYYMGAGMVHPKNLRLRAEEKELRQKETMGAANAQRNLNLN